VIFDDGAVWQRRPAIETGVADLADPMLKDRIAELKVTRIDYVIRRAGAMAANRANAGAVA
jgi:hypothetical protein